MIKLHFAPHFTALQQAEYINANFGLRCQTWRISEDEIWLPSYEDKTIKID